MLRNSVCNCAVDIKDLFSCGTVIHLSFIIFYISFENNLQNINEINDYAVLVFRKHVCTKPVYLFIFLVCS